MDFIVDFLISRDHFVITDPLTKMLRYIPMDKMDAAATARAFYLWVWKDFDFSITRTQFVSEFWYELSPQVSGEPNASVKRHSV